VSELLVFLITKCLNCWCSLWQSVWIVGVPYDKVSELLVFLITKCLNCWCSLWQCEWYKYVPYSHVFYIKIKYNLVWFFDNYIVFRTGKLPMYIGDKFTFSLILDQKMARRNIQHIGGCRKLDTSWIYTYNWVLAKRKTGIQIILITTSTITNTL